MKQKILITGASSGIGEALAYAYAKQGAILGLIARRKDILDTVADKCKSLGGTVYNYPMDVTDQSIIKFTIQNFIDDVNDIDIVIANAGVGGMDALKNGDATETNRILTTNILGISNTVIPCIPKIIDQQYGHIVVVSSVAGFRGLVAHGAYSASKAAIRIMADSWRYSLSRYNIHVTNICPGFIETPLVKNNRFKMPFLMDADTAAVKILFAVEKRKKCYIFPWQWKVLLPLIKVVPDWLIKWGSTKANL